jgi:hypothetical protein
MEHRIDGDPPDFEQQLGNVTPLPMSRSFNKERGALNEKREYKKSPLPNLHHE